MVRLKPGETLPPNRLKAGAWTPDDDGYRDQEINCPSTMLERTTKKLVFIQFNSFINATLRMKGLVVAPPGTFWSPQRADSRTVAMSITASCCIKRAPGMLLPGWAGFTAGALEFT